MGRLKDSDIEAADQRRRPITLGQLVEKNQNVFCWCNRCTHNAEVESRHLMGQLGPAIPVPELGGYMKCSNCSAKDIATSPVWPKLGRVARHA